MQVLTGIVKNGSIEINQPVPAKDGTSVVIFIMPRIIESNSNENLFGKWDWYTEEMEKEIHLYQQIFFKKQIPL